MAEKMTRGQIQDLVGKFAAENPKYRAALLSNPKATIEKQLNTTLGATTVKAVADTADTVHVIDPVRGRRGRAVGLGSRARRRWQAGHHGELPGPRRHRGQQHRDAAEPLIWRRAAARPVAAALRASVRFGQRSARCPAPRRAAVSWRRAAARPVAAALRASVRFGQRSARCPAPRRAAVSWRRAVPRPVVATPGSSRCLDRAFSSYTPIAQTIPGCQASRDS